jgi:hypothetical protein
MTGEWKAAVAKLRVRHADREATPIFEIEPGDPPSLHVRVLNTRDTVTDERIASLAISSVRLRCWPGETVALRWLAAAWAGYCQHEALELVTADGKRPIDPHASCRLDRGLRNGLPVELTAETLLQTFEAVMPADVAAEMAR